MCYAYVMPDTTSKYGVVGKDGKQSISVYKNGARYTYIAEKNKVDEFSKVEEKANQNGVKGILGLVISAMIAMPSTFAVRTGSKKYGNAGLAAAGLGLVYSIAKLISAYQNNEQAKKILEEIKKSQ